MSPSWLHVLSIFALALGFLSAAAIAVDVARRPQKMWIMNVVWPVTGLFAGPPTLWGYYRFGQPHMHMRGDPRAHPEQPFAAVVAKGTMHCGAGCTIGDILAEWVAYAFPVLAVWLGYGGLFNEKMFAVWILDYALAFLIGIAFQYFTIAPMRHLGLREGLKVAVLADALSLTAWQVGMYGFMAIAQFILFRGLLGTTLDVASPEFWFMMQIAMLCGFATSYPVNWWLIRTGVKEAM